MNNKDTTKNLHIYIYRNNSEKNESVLPKSPRIRSKVVKQLMCMTDHDSSDSHAKEGRPPLDLSVVKMVNEIYDDNGRISPGKEDDVKVKLNGEPKTYQKRNLSITFDNLHQLISRNIYRL